jgi:hypothetical protein
MTYVVTLSTLHRIQMDAITTALGAVVFGVLYAGTGLIRWAAHR